MKRTTLIFVAFFAAVACSHPPDSEFAAILHRDRPVFEELRRMLKEDDRVDCVDQDSFSTERPLVVHSTPNDVLSAARWDAYRERLSRIHVHSVCNLSRFYEGEDVILYKMSSRGTIFGGSGKGIAYLTPGAPRRWKTEYELIEYRSISDNWFVFYERNW